MHEKQQKIRKRKRAEDEEPERAAVQTENEDIQREPILVQQKHIGRGVLGVWVYRGRLDHAIDVFSVCVQ